MVALDQISVETAGRTKYGTAPRVVRCLQFVVVMGIVYVAWLDNSTEEAHDASLKLITNSVSRKPSMTTAASAFDQHGKRRSVVVG